MLGFSKSLSVLLTKIFLSLAFLTCNYKINHKNQKQENNRFGGETEINLLLVLARLGHYELAP